jgi:hypothetical protein
MSGILSLVFRHYAKVVLGAALLISTGAHAGPTRGLNLATAEAPPPNQAQQPASDPSSTPSATAPDDQLKIKTTASLTAPVVEAKPTGRHAPVEARIIHELHRHGIIGSRAPVATNAARSLGAEARCQKALDKIR